MGTQRYKQKNFIWLSSATEIMLVILWTESDFCIISDCSNSINNKLKNFFNPVDHSLHQKNILRKNVKCLLACASYSHTEFMSWHRRIQNHVKYSKLKLFTKIVNGWKFWIIFTKRSIFEYYIGLWISLWMTNQELIDQAYGRYCDNEVFL